MSLQFLVINDKKMAGQVRERVVALLQFILFSNSYISLCAVVMCQTTALLFQLKLPAHFLPFIFLATLSSYALHWYLTPTTSNQTERNQWNRQHKPILLGMLVGSAITGLILLIQLRTYLLYFIPVIAVTLLYTAPKINHRPFRFLRQIAILKTAYLAFVWTFVTAVIPPFMVNPAWNTTMTLWAINRFLFIYSVCFWFDYRDRDDDKQSRWLTLVSMMTRQRALYVFYSIAGCFMLSLALLYQHGMELRPVVCLGMPMLLLVGSARHIPTWLSDYWYYAYMDGLLMLSGLLLCTSG